MTPLSFTPILMNISYASIFIWFLIFNNFVPIFEELVLVVIGYSSALGVVNPVIAIIVSIMALGIVDGIVYFVALNGSKHLKFVEKFVKKVVGYNLIIKYKMKMQQNFNKTFIILTFTPRMRFLGPALAGILKRSWKKFLFLESLSLSLFVCFYFLCGFFFYQKITKVFSYLQNWRHLIFVGFITILLILSYFIARWAKKKYKI